MPGILEDSPDIESRRCFASGVDADERVAMLFIHLSDIHFKGKEVFRQDDPNAGLRDDLLADVKHMRKKIGRGADAILISGDIAYSGAASEYEFACPSSGFLGQFAA